MRKIFITTILVLCAICEMKAQSDTVTVHVDGTVSLESLMEGVWEQGGECLRLTGTPTEEDISYLKGKFAIGRFNIYDLRHFELKRIPDRFFAGSNVTEATIILPECLEYIGAFAFDTNGLTVILTGKFPITTVESFLHGYDNENGSFYNKLIASEDNPYCKNFITYEINYNGKKLYLESIYSLDEKTLYFLPHSFFTKFFENIEIINGTKEIRGHGIPSVERLLLPESIETIKMDLANAEGVVGLIYKVICNAKRPPENNNIGFEICDLYVPEESYDLYCANQYALGIVHYCNDVLWNPLLGVNNTIVSKLKVKCLNGSYIISSERTILKLTIYNLQGQLVLQEKIGGKSYSLNSTALPKSPLLLRVELENGECETIKIIP